MFGYNRAKIGFISPAADVHCDFEFFTVLPDGVEMIVVPTAVHFSTFPNTISAQSL